LGNTVGDGGNTEFARVSNLEASRTFLADSTIIDLTVSNFIEACQLFCRESLTGLASSTKSIGIKLTAINIAIALVLESRKVEVRVAFLTSFSVQWHLTVWNIKNGARGKISKKNVRRSTLFTSALVVLDTIGNVCIANTSVGRQVEIAIALLAD